MCTAVAINRSNKRRQWRPIRSVSPREARQRGERAASKSRERPESETASKGNAEMMTRQNDFVDCDRHKSRPAAVFEIGPTRTMPQIIIGPGTGGKPAFNRPYDCVLIMEDTLDVSACTYTPIQRRER